MSCPGFDWTAHRCPDKATNTFVPGFDKSRRVLILFNSKLLISSPKKHQPQNQPPCYLRDPPGVLSKCRAGNGRTTSTLISIVTGARCRSAGQIRGFGFPANSAINTRILNFLVAFFLGLLNTTKKSPCKNSEKDPSMEKYPYRIHVVTGIFTYI